MLFLLILAGLIGLAVGSFLTAFLPRLGTGEGIIRSRSHCVHCGKTLSAIELAPVLSFLIQGGRCRSCRGFIPRSYPLIELATGALFFLIAWALINGFLPPPAFSPRGNALALGEGRGEFIAAFLFYAFFVASAAAISAYDMLYRLIPAALVVPLAAVGFLSQLAGAFRSGDFFLLLPIVGAALGAFLLFWALWYCSGGRAMGRGDADVALAIGLFLGPQATLLGILFAFWIGALYGILGVASGKLAWKSAIPFAPFLFAGAVIALFLAEHLATVIFPLLV